LIVPSPAEALTGTKPVATSSLAAGRTAAVNVSAHAATPVRETQTTHDQSKKQSGEESNSAPSASNPTQTQTQAQINLAARVISQDSSSDQPHETTSAAAGNAAPLPKQDSTAAEHIGTTAAPISLNSARLLEGLGQSELRVGMKMGDLGNVEIRTQLHHDQLHAEISVERGDLSRTLAAELPALQQKLHEQDVPLASIVVHHQASAGSGSFERGSQQQQAFTPMAHVFGVDAMPPSFSPEEIRSTESGLDIHI
jgi:hypothetical protein